MDGKTGPTKVECIVCRQIVDGHTMNGTHIANIHDNNLHSPCLGSNCNATPVDV